MANVQKKNEPTTIAQAKTLQQSRQTGSSDGITDCCLGPYLPHVPGCLKPMHPTIWFAYWFLVSINSTLRDSGVCVPHCCTLFFFLFRYTNPSKLLDYKPANQQRSCAVCIPCRRNFVSGRQACARVNSPPHNSATATEQLICESAINTPPPGRQWIAHSGAVHDGGNAVAVRCCERNAKCTRKSLAERKEQQQQKKTAK